MGVRKPYVSANCYTRCMTTEQGALFDKRTFRGSKPQNFTITPPTSDQTVIQTLPAYHAHLGSGGYSQYTPDDYTADIKLFGQYVSSKPLGTLETTDLQQWISEIKQIMPPKTVSRKVSALGNYFRWLTTEQVLDKNPARHIRANRVTPPLTDLLYDSEVDKLLAVASSNPRTYLLLLLLLETGMKKAELLELDTANFDFSDKYMPVLLIKHSGKHVFKDRKLKLPVQVVPVFKDYVSQYNVTGVLFPYTARALENMLADAKNRAGITKPVTAGMMRDLFVVRGVKRGEKLDALLEKIGLARTSFDDAKKKYGRLTREAL
jgi:site-specific recombinase XerD